MNRNIFFFLALAIPLLTMGAGCTSLSTTVVVPTVSTSDSSLAPTTSPVTVAPTTSSDGTRTLVTSEPDVTWVLYTNKALGYTVNTPTKGGNTPTWKMKYVDQSDPHMINGCYFNTNPTTKNKAVSDTVVVPDGTTFCHSNNKFGDSPSFFVVDDYATVAGKKFIVIEFTKVTTGASAFDTADYQKTLDGIMGTFQLNTVPTPVVVTPPSKDLE